MSFLTKRGRGSDVPFGLTALYDLVGVTAGVKPGLILSRSLSAGGLRMACRAVQCTSAPRPPPRRLRVILTLEQSTAGPRGLLSPRSLSVLCQRKISNEQPPAVRQESTMYIRA